MAAAAAAAAANNTGSSSSTTSSGNEGMTDVEEDRPGNANGQRPPGEQPALPSVVPNKPPLTRSLSKMPKDQRTSRERLSWCVISPPHPPTTPATSHQPPL